MSAENYDKPTCEEVLADYQQTLNMKGYGPAQITGFMTRVATRLAEFYPAGAFTSDIILADLAAAPNGQPNAKAVAVGIADVDFTVAITDATDADLVAFRQTGGEGYVANGNVEVPVGTNFKVSTATADFTDNRLASAKGSAVAAGDVYRVTGLGFTGVVYLRTE